MKISLQLFLCTKITEVNLSAFIYILFHEDVSPSIVTYKYYIIQIYSGITCGRVLSGELYAQILQKLIFPYFSTACFVEFSLLSSGLHETACRQIKKD